MNYVVPDGDGWVYWDGNVKHYFDTEAEALLVAAETAERFSIMDKFLKPYNQVRAGARTWFDTQQGIIEAGIKELKLAKFITFSANPETGQVLVVITLTDEQLAAMGLDRSVIEKGLAAMYRVSSGIAESDSEDIVAML